jgi:hypothetical protein
MRIRSESKNEHDVITFFTNTMTPHFIPPERIKEIKNDEKGLDSNDNRSCISNFGRLQQWGR